jgi:hypothetical protein
MDNMFYSSFLSGDKQDKAAHDARFPVHAFFLVPIYEQEYGVNVNEIRRHSGESMNDCGVAFM